MTNSQLEQIKWAMAELRERVEEEFFGEVTFKFQGGRFVHAEVKQSKKPPGNS